MPPFMPLEASRYYLSKVYRSAKIGVATVLTLVSGGALLAGWITSGGVFYIILGGSGLLGSAFLFYDASKAQADLAKAMYKNDILVAEYKQTAVQLRNETNLLHNEVEQTHKALEKSVQHTNQLQKLQEKAVPMIQKLQTAVQQQHQQVGELTTQVEQLDKIKQESAAEREQLSKALDEARSQTARLQLMCERAALSEQASSAQIGKLKLIVESTQKVLLAVASEGDRFEQFGKVIDQQVIKLDQQSSSFEHTAMVLDTLLNKLETKTFTDLDKNNDGVITADEFAAFTNKPSAPATAARSGSKTRK